MPEEYLPKPEILKNEGKKSLPLPDEDLPLPDKDLPLPEKEITAHASEPVIVKNENPKSSGKSPILKFIILGMLTTLIIAGLIGAYALGKNSSNSQIVETKISPTQITDAEMKWETYEIDGFTFNYPLGWKPSPSTSEKQTFIEISDPNKSDRFIRVFKEVGSVEEFAKEAGGDAGLSYTAVVEKYIYQDKEITESTITHYQYDQQTGKHEPDGSKSHAMYIEKDGYTYSVFGDLKDKELIEQIFSSLKFTDTITEQANQAIIIADVEKELGDSYNSVAIKGMYGENYALGTAGFTGAGGGIEFIAHLENGVWKVIWRGNEVPGCSEFTSYPDFPKGLNCDPSY